MAVIFWPVDLSGEWPVPPGAAVVMLLDVSTRVEQELIERWAHANRPAATAATDVELIALPDPGSRRPPGGLAARLRDAEELWLAPLRVAWLAEEHDGERAVRIRDVVRGLGDPRRPRPSRQRHIAERDPDRCCLVLGQPSRATDLRDRWVTVSGGDTGDGFASFVIRQATLALERAESHVRGAAYKVPRLVREELAASARFRSGIASLAEDLGRDVDEVAREADGYLEEMVTGWSRLLVDLSVRLGRYMFRRGYDPELDYVASEVARLRDVAQERPLVLLPSHKSNLDALVVNVALHDNGLPRTHIFGGINMAFWPMGAIFRRSGTAFIRRDTRGKPVYTYTLREYIGYLMEKRFSLQFYIEGGRSRTGKLLPPKLGLMTYVADAYRQGRIDDVALVPVAIAYEQLQETREFAREAQGGTKTAESLAWVARLVRESRWRYGKIYVRFGDPVSLQESLGPGDGERDRDAERLALQKVAFEVSRRINQAMPITATSLVTLSLLGAQGRALTVDQIRATVHDPLQYTIRRQLPITTEVDLATNEGVRNVLMELERNHVVSRYDAGPDEVFVLGTDQNLAAAFYRNSVIHFFLHGALAQAALARASTPGIEDSLATFWHAVLAGRDLLKFEFFFEPREEFRAAITAELASQVPDWESRVTAGPESTAELLAELTPLTAHTVLRSFLEAYGVVAATLVRHGSGPIVPKEFLTACSALGHQCQLQGRIHSPESLARPLFSTALDLAASRGLTEPTGDVGQRRLFLEEIRTILRDIEIIELASVARIVALIDADR